MTSPSLRIVGPSGTLVVDRNGRSLNLLGKVPASSAVVTQAFGSTGTGIGRRAGYSEYSFTASAGQVPVMAFVGLPSGKVVHPISQTISGSTITVRVYCGDAPNDADGFQQQYATDVFIFGMLTTAVGTAGLKMKNDAGALTHVFTDIDGPPLFPRGRVSEAGITIDTGTVRTIPALTYPAICGRPGHYELSSTTAGALYKVTLWQFGWRWDGSTGLYLDRYRQQVFTNDGPLVDSFPSKSESLVIEATGL